MSLVANVAEPNEPASGGLLDVADARIDSIQTARSNLLRHIETLPDGGERIGRVDIHIS